MPSTVGCRLIQLNDPIQRTTIPLALLYPASEHEQAMHFGPYNIDLARNAPCLGQNLPLVVISHGNGGTPWTWRDLAKHLARSGFLVALPEHPGNSRNDNSLTGTAANLENRPRHITLAIDALTTDPFTRQHLAPERIGILGHSIGACTALSLAGGRPWSAPHESPDGKLQPVPVTPDPRVRALVLLNPATFWFAPETLHEVRVPILIYTGEDDNITPASHAETIKRGVSSTQIEHRSIPGAGHFSFMSRFPPQMTRPDFPPSQDPPGFSREAIYPALFADVTDFLKRTL